MYESIRYCREVLPAVSRTFALGIELLRDPLRDETCIAYLVCRILDTIEDTTLLPAGERAALLERASTELADPAHWSACCRAIEKMFTPRELTGADHDLNRHAGLVLGAFHRMRPGAIGAMRHPVKEMAEGMAATVQREISGRGLHLESMDDLERYCYYVAGTVGHLLTNLFVMDRGSIDDTIEKRMRSHSVRFGLGLQVTNIIKNVTDDITRGVSYVPLSLFRKAGIELQSLVDNPQDGRGRLVVGALVEETLSWLDEALEYIKAIPLSEDDIRLFCALPLALAVRTLALAVRTTDVFSERTLKISRREVKAIHTRLNTALKDNGKLERIYHREREAVAAVIHGSGR